ncbi:MAG: hypothetical protein ACP5OK_08955, partial [Thermoprotei archaeon]
MRCKRCGKELDPFRAPSTKYCWGCSLIVKRERAKKTRESRRARGRASRRSAKLGDKCKYCGYSIP